MSILLFEVDAFNLGTEAVETLRYATHGYTSLPTDTPADAWYANRIRGGFSLSQSLYANGTTGGASEVGAGSISLANPDGALDVLLTGYALAGRRVRVYTIEPGAALSTRVLRFTGTAALPNFDRESVTIGLRDRTTIFDQDIQTTTYLGNNTPPNGIEGEGDLKGKKKPLAHGVVKNVPLVMVNKQQLIYQAHDGPTVSGASVYEGGVLLGQSLIPAMTVTKPDGAGSSWPSVTAVTGWVLTGLTYDAVNKWVNKDAGTAGIARYGVTGMVEGYLYRLSLWLDGMAYGGGAVTVMLTGPGGLSQTLATITTGAGVRMELSFTPDAGLTNGTLYVAFDGAVSGHVWRMAVHPANTWPIDLTALEAVAAAPGSAHSCQAEGLVRLAVDASKAVTANMIGELFSGDGVTSTISGLVRDIVLIHGGLTAGDLDAAAFTALAADESLPQAGIFLPDGGPIRSVLDRLCGFQAWWHFTPSGILTVGRLLAPEGQTAAAALDLVTQARDVELVPSNDVGEGVPVWRVNLRYDHNELVMESEDLIGGGGWTSGVLTYAVTDERRAFVSQEWRTATAEDASIKAAWPQAAELTVDTCLVSDPALSAPPVSVETEAARLLALYGVPRLRLKATVLDPAAQGYTLGQVLEITYDRWSLAAGRNMVVIGRDDAWDDKGLLTVTFDLWG